MAGKPHGAQKEKWERHRGGKQRKIKHDAQAVFTPGAQLAHKGVGKARRRAAHKARQGRQKRSPVKAGLDNQHAAQQRREHAGDLHGGGPLLQQEHGENNGEKGRELIEHVGIRQHQMVHSIEIQQQADGTENGPAGKV